jgi:hypothetical protein
MPAIAGVPDVFTVAGVPGVVGISAVAFIPAIAGVPANDSVFAVASFHANPCVPVLLNLVSLRTGTVLYNETYKATGLLLSDCHFFFYQNIEYRTGEFEKLSDYRISDQGLNLSDYRNYKKTIGCPALN